MNVRFDPAVSPFPLIESEKFCEWEEEHLHDIVPQRLIKPIASLMETRRDIHRAAAIGALNKDRALEHLQKHADEVFEALKMLWSEI